MRPFQWRYLEESLVRLIIIFLTSSVVWEMIQPFEGLQVIGFKTMGLGIYP